MNIILCIFSIMGLLISIKRFKSLMYEVTETKVTKDITAELFLFFISLFELIRILFN